MQLNELFTRRVNETTWTKTQGQRTVSRGLSGLVQSTREISNVLKARHEEA